MEIEKEYSCLQRNGIVYHKLIECDNDYQETLQQYYDDILSIIECKSNCHILGIKIENGTVTVEGKHNVMLTYCTDDNELCYADFEKEFSKKISVDNLSDNAFVHALPCVKYCNYRLVNQRRIDVHISFNLDVDIYDKVSCPCIKSCDNSRLKQRIVKSANVFDSRQCKVEFDEEFSIPSGSNPIKRIISSSSNVCVDECKIIKDKVLLKLNVAITAIYTIDDKNSGIEKVEYSFGVSKIIDSNGIFEDDCVIANASIGNLYLRSKSNGDSLCVIESYGDVSLSILFIHQHEINVVMDGYVVGRNTRCDYSNYSCVSSGERIVDNISNSLIFSFNNSFKEIYNLSLNIVNKSVVGNTIRAIIRATALCRTEDNDICCYSSETELNISTKYQKALLSLSVLSFDYNIENDFKIKVNATFLLDSFQYNTENIRVLCEIEADDSVIEYPALTLYYAKKKEDLWEIAKKFSSDINMIKIENEIKTDILEQNQLLIIPSV